METFWFFWLRFRRAYDSVYDSDFWFSLGHKRSYDSAYDSDSVASENQPLLYKTNRLHFAVGLYSNNAQRTSKRGKKISHATRLRLVAYFLVLTTFWRHLCVIRVQTHGKMDLFETAHIPWQLNQLKHANCDSHCCILGSTDSPSSTSVYDDLCNATISCHVRLFERLKSEDPVFKSRSDR